MATETSAPDIQSDLHADARQEPPDERPGGSNHASSAARYLPRFLQREHLFGQIVRFVVVGGINTIVDYSIFNLLYHVVGLAAAGVQHHLGVGGDT